MLMICHIPVQEGDRVAQLIIEKIQTPEVVEVQVRASGKTARSDHCTNRVNYQDLDETLRGAGGFGSTGGHGSL